MTEVDDARARILEKAEQCFLTHGYSRVTMDDIATELRMSKKTLYRHFSSKEELGEAAIVVVFKRALECFGAGAPERQAGASGEPTRGAQGRRGNSQGAACCRRGRET